MPGHVRGQVQLQRVHQLLVVQGRRRLRRSEGRLRHEEQHLQMLGGTVGLGRGMVSWILGTGHQEIHL